MFVDCPHFPGCVSSICRLEKILEQRAIVDHGLAQFLGPGLLALAALGKRQERRRKERLHAV